MTPTDEADQLPLTTGPPAVFGPSPGTLIRDLAKAMDGVNHPPATDDDDMLTTDADMLPTLVASPPVEIASPAGSVGGICVSMPSTDLWEKLDPWTQFTAYEQADGWSRRGPVEPSTAPPTAAGSSAPAAPPADATDAVHPAPCAHEHVQPHLHAGRGLRREPERSGG